MKKQIVRTNFLVDLDLKKEFQQACLENDQQISQVLRSFMRDYIQSTKALKQEKNS